MVRIGYINANNVFVLIIKGTMYKFKIGLNIN